MSNENDSHFVRRIQKLLDRLRNGDERARDELLDAASVQLHVLSRMMIRGFPMLPQWHQSGDVSQNAALRLWHALSAVTPHTPREFFALASLQIRRVLLDMIRSIYGRTPSDVDEGNRQRRPLVHVGIPPRIWTNDDSNVDCGPEVTTDDPKQLAFWTEFHNQVGRLSDELREVVDLLFYQELTQQEAAEIIGVNVRTIKRRWRAARNQLHQVIRDCLL